MVFQPGGSTITFAESKINLHVLQIIKPLYYFKAASTISEKCFHTGLRKFSGSVVTHFPSFKSFSTTKYVTFCITANFLNYQSLLHKKITVSYAYCYGSGYFAVDGNLPSETILP